MKSYCLGFFFDPEFKEVALIRKLKPEYQKGKLNGIGGSIEELETPHHAMVREFYEETHHKTEPEQWHHYGRLHGREKWEVHLFWGVGKVRNVRSATSEEVGVYSVQGILLGLVQDLAGPTMGNVKWLVMMALAIAKGEDGCTSFDIEEQAWRT